MSCLNNANFSCLNDGQCIANNCVCSSACFIGDYCETYFNAIDLPFASALLQDTSEARVIYIILIAFLVIIGLINNIAGLLTFTRESIRITACGVYLIVFSTCTSIMMVFLLTAVLTIVEYDTSSFRIWSCYANPYISLTMGFTSIWISVGIATERVLIECFDMNLYGTRLHVVLISISLFTFSAISNLPTIFARVYAADPSGKITCMYDYNTYPAWGYVDTVFSYIHAIVPCTIHLVCSACIFTTIARRKILIHRNNYPNQRLYSVWLRQLYIHRDFLIPPIFLIACLLPNAVHGHFLVKCVPYASLGQLRFHITFIFLLYIPSVFVYIVYIYPNDSYRKEFRETWFYKILSYCFCQRYKKPFEQTHQLTTTTRSNKTLSESVENSHL